jgi:hypothetical protein
MCCELRHNYHNTEPFTLPLEILSKFTSLGLIVNPLISHILKLKFNQLFYDIVLCL